MSDDKLDLDNITPDNLKALKVQEKKRGRPKVIPVEKHADVQSLVDEVKELLASPDMTEAKTKDELIKNTYLIITKIMQVWGQDIRTLDPAKVVRQKTPNGVAKINPVGLTKDDRDYLLKSLAVAKDLLAVFFLEAEQSKDKRATLDTIMQKVYRGFVKAEEPELDKPEN